MAAIRHALASPHGEEHVVPPALEGVLDVMRRAKKQVIESVRFFVIVEHFLAVFRAQNCSMVS